MLSLATSKALKDAGLKWEPQIYDYFESMNGIEIAECLDLEDGKIVGINGWMIEFDHDLFFLPRLDQLLAEIEKRGKIYTLTSDGRDNYNVLVWFWSDEAAEIDFGCGWCPDEDFYADTPDEAAAQALLWIMREGNA